MKLFSLIFLGASLVSCATWIASSFSSYDSRPISIQLLNVFNQRIPSGLSKETWKGDWLFRRERLDLVDRELRATRPDLVVLQEMLAKKGSPSESDRNILAKGALSGYEWFAQRQAEYKDTQEDEFHAVAVGLPVEISKLNKSLARSWAIGVDGFVSLSILELEGQPLSLFNVQMPSGNKGGHLWYRFVEERIREVMKEASLCPRRTIVAGYLPSLSGSRRYQELVEGLQLKDVSEGYCEVASDCFTGTPLNDLFLAISGGQSPSQADRILVHNSALVISSSLVFKTSTSAGRDGQKYGLSRLWPSTRFGWGTTLRLARCDKN